VKLNRRGKIEKAVRLNVALGVDTVWDTFLLNGKLIELHKCSSKEIRESLSTRSIITKFKIGLELEERQARTWLFKVNKLTSTAHKNALLRVAHGEIYTQERLARFGLSNDVGCPRCDLVEDLEHKIYKCTYVDRIWTLITNKIGLTNYDRLEAIMGVHTELELLNVHTEILQRILRLPKEGEYLIHPKHFVKLAIKNVLKNERNEKVRNTLENLLAKF
jgi:hypothetical protein